MKIPASSRIAAAWLRLSCAGFMLIALCALLYAQSGSPAQAIGRLLSSNPVSIEGRTTWTSPKEDLEDPTPLLFNGSKISMQAGIALLQMEDSGGVAGFCGRTSITLMKSKNTMLYAMNSGTISLDLSSSTTDRVLTPDLAVEWKSIAAGRKQGVVSLDSRGGLCVQNFAGGVKILDLLTGQSLDLPAGSSVQLQSGQAGAARISKNLECGCTKSAPLGAGAAPLAAGQVNPMPRSPEPAAAPPPSQDVPPQQKPPSAPASPEPAATPPPSQVVPAQQKPPSALTTATDENNRPPQPPVDNGRQQARFVDPQNSLASPPATSHALASPPPALDNPLAPEATGAKADTEPAPVMSATMAVSAETLPKRAERKTFGQKVKNFFRIIFFMKKKTPPPASDSS